MHCSTLATAWSIFLIGGRPVGDNLRELTVVYPYIIRYEVLGNDVTILRVRHGMRRP
jgi:toxin ParE1/3/4